MGEKIVVGQYPKGLRKDVTPFNVDNDSFPVLINAYQWRGRVKRKRGTSLLSRLQRYFDSTNVSYNSGTTTITLDGSGNGNLLSNASWTLQANATLVPGTVTLTASGGPTTYTDPTKDGYLTPTGTGGANTINYSTGAILIPAQAGDTVTATFYYNPCLPVMGLEDFISTTAQFPGTLGFDTTYSYSLIQSVPYPNYDVSFYKNPITGAFSGYVQKANETATTWNGQDYQQFSTINYLGALWACNGINVPFTVTNIGMQFAPKATITFTSQTATTLTLSISNCPLVIGDFIFLNEWTSATPANATTLNFLSGYVTACAPNTPPLANKTLTITFPNANIPTDTYTPGIVQYLTNRSDTTKDCIRWYDGDPTNGSIAAPALTGHQGWVNFAPPLSRLSYSIDNEIAQQYYLVGARVIYAFKDRILFFGPVIQTSTPNSQVYLPDTVIYSQNGSPYYTASFSADPSLSSTVFTPILVPTNMTGAPTAFWEDQTGYGGSTSAAIDQEILTVSPNQDALIVGFTREQTRFIYTGNDISPFNFYIVNSEFGSGSTFSVINMDEGVQTIGSRGIIITSQTQCLRTDEQIPDEVFEIQLINNGSERVTAQRDFLNEWSYFTYPVNYTGYKFPCQTLQYNYKDKSWAIFRETYTTYGLFRKQNGYTWATIGMKYPTWADWNDPWNSGESTLLQQEVIAGNQQGFVLVRADGTNEGFSLYIQNISGSTITSPNHCLNAGDYILIAGVLGLGSSQVNGQIFSVANTTQNTFMLNPPIAGFTYAGGGLIQRMYVPFVQTRQFPPAWGMGRKTRLGVQQYLFTTTANGQITLLIFLSEDADNPYNNLEYIYNVGIVPAISQNNSLIYSTLLYTCPESTNLGLTPANVNLQMPTAGAQQQIWHRMNTSLLGDTVQIGFTLNDTQMRDVNLYLQFAEIEMHGMNIDVTPSQVLA